MEDSKITQGIFGVFLVLVSSMSFVDLGVDSYDYGYVCSSNGNFGIFTGNAKHSEPLSGTGKTAYYTNDVGESKYKTCRNGVWIPVKEYAKDNNISLPDIIKNDSVEDNIVVLKNDTVVPEQKPIESDVKHEGIKEYLCNHKGCNKISGIDGKK